MSAACFYGNDVANFTRSEVVQILRAAQGRACSICQKHLTRFDATIDHVVPRSLGGSHSFRNWLLAHKVCNEAKGSEPPQQHEIDLLSKVIARLSL